MWPPSFAEVLLPCLHELSFQSRSPGLADTAATSLRYSRPNPVEVSLLESCPLRGNSHKLIKNSWKQPGRWIHTKKLGSKKNALLKLHQSEVDPRKKYPFVELQVASFILDTQNPAPPVVDWFLQRLSLWSFGTSGMHPGFPVEMSWGFV